MKRLYKSRQDRVIDGVCGGIAEYFGVSSVIVRLIFLLLLFFGGVGLLLYIAGMLIIPENPKRKEESDEQNIEQKKTEQASSKDLHLILGIVLIVLGIGLLLENLGVPFWRFFKVGFDYALPILIVGVGVLLIVLYVRERQGDDKLEGKSEKGESSKEIIEVNMKRLYRSKKNRMIFGVCGGLGEYFNTDPTIIRILWAILAISSLGFAVLLYLAMAIIMPEEP